MTQAQTPASANAMFELPPVIDRPPTAAKPKKPVNPYKNEPRVWVTLERSDRIPPTGQFFGYTADVVQNDGSIHRIPREFILRPGEKAFVPIGLLDVLNNAVESVPVKNADDQITHYEDRLRFSYRIHRNDPPPDGWEEPEQIQALKEPA